MNDRAKQILIVLVAARLIPWIQKVFGVRLTMDDIGDLFVLAMVIWHSGAATACMIMKHYFPWLGAQSNPTQPPQPGAGATKS